ncbi:hypothetical protein [Salidesulfovibrio brasiliensis]
MQSGRIAWNGISLDPGERPLRLLDRNTLVLGDGTDAVQLRWKRVPGRFRPEKHVRKLSRGKARAEARDETTPHGFHVTDFHGENLEGCVLYHKGTNLIVELQCAPDSPGKETLVASLADHSGGDTVPWQAFGLTFRLPVHWLLDSSSFRPGRFVMKFIRPRGRQIAPDAPEKGVRTFATLQLERLAPADALLDGKPLHEWGRAIWPDEFVPKSDEEPLRWAREPRGLKQLLPGRSNRYGWLHRPAQANAVLAAFLHSRRPCLEEFSTITEKYGVLSQENPAKA